MAVLALPGLHERKAVAAWMEGVTEDASEVRTGFECGIKLVGQDELMESDIIELYEKQRVR